MILKYLAVGPLMANCFIIGCEETKKALVIDPGDDVEQILIELTENNLKLEYILNTHGHFDHAGGNNQLKSATGAEIMIHKEDAPFLNVISAKAKMFGLSATDSPAADKFLEEGDIITCGTITAKVIHTPGHSPGGLSFAIDNMLFVGDTLFDGSIGRTDFDGGDYNTLIKNIQNKLFAYDDDTKVYTGHGPSTTIGKEKRYNPFCKIK
ncbi:MAG: MBL fold metallo-hydrolase [Deltaproteobacteria bacterium]|nr:MBL fold metallo-hydrolase [Deltaproteobacteria bacterium]